MASKYHQRSSRNLPGESYDCARAGFTPEEVAVNAAAVLEGEPAATPVILNDRAYTVRVRFPNKTAPRSTA